MEGARGYFQDAFYTVSILRGVKAIPRCGGYWLANKLLLIASALGSFLLRYARATSPRLDLCHLDVVLLTRLVFLTTTSKRHVCSAKAIFKSGRRVAYAKNESAREKIELSY
jgi:hypothetical protein